jgi:hypothetical protein
VATRLRRQRGRGTTTRLRSSSLTTQRETNIVRSKLGRLRRRGERVITTVSRIALPLAQVWVQQIVSVAL